jgi:hypothetical protein
MNYSVLFVIISSYLIIISLGCRCLPTTVAENFKQSDIVFFGKVSKISPIQGSINIAVEFEILRVWKGDPFLTTIEIRTCKDTACCGFGFFMGKDYVVFADKGERPSFVTSICSRTQPLSLSIVSELESYTDLRPLLIHNS